MKAEVEKLEPGERGEDPRTLSVVMRQAAAATAPTRWCATGAPAENAAG